MKKLHIYVAIAVLAFSFSACNDEWKEELYTQMVSFKARLTSEGVSEVYLRYNKNGEVTYNLPVIVSGSQSNHQDLYVKIEVDSDTLNIYNKEKFQYRTDLYFKQLPEQFYQLSSPTCFIPQGVNTQNYPIKFKFDNLDLVERYVLPLTIQDDPSYISNDRKGWRKALLYIRPFNDFSGKYSSTSMNVYLDGQTTLPLVSSTRTAWVVDERSVFFYAGVFEEKSEARGEYKVVMDFSEPETQPDGTQTGTLNVYAPNSEINFELTTPATYQIREVSDPTRKYLVTRYCTVYLKYKYDDISTVPGKRIRYRADGSMTMARLTNTLIPDEDQAIEWEEE
ncbi:DUF4973 domain-containing protein [Niabella ginsengisoli]|uniref:DUF4973 domain-containing protein n=1 Tax=Niabella ginsengisoli TaxID=522298 RepID=A0ABS9SDK0_9BACT|nr:DUF4973 domain-containing protein [Niabella ginsengisoli]MCH5596441.1 DUF4973 domain-containing protein [Niabella ginsengisoli]